METTPLAGLKPIHCRGAG